MHRRICGPGVALVVVGLAAGAVACGSGATGSSTTGGTASSTTVTTETATSSTSTTSSMPAGDGWILSLLARVPDTAETAALVAVTDFVGAAQAAGTGLPAAGAFAAEVRDYLLALPIDAVIPDLVRDTVSHGGDLRAELGVDVAAMTQSVTAGSLPRLYQVLAGDFDAAEVDDRVRADPEWADLLTTVIHEGVAYYAWGEDLESHMDRITPARPLGVGGRLALDDGYLYWAPWTAGIESLIDAAAGRVSSLEDRAPLQAAARILQQEGVYSAILTAAPLTLAPVLGGETQPVQSGGLAPYIALGLGGGRDAAGSFWVVVAVHTDKDMAERSVQSFRSALAEGRAAQDDTPWSVLVSSAEVTAQGASMVAVLRSESPNLWLKAFYWREPLLAVNAQG